MSVDDRQKPVKVEVAKSTNSPTEEVFDSKSIPTTVEKVAELLGDSSPNIDWEMRVWLAVMLGKMTEILPDQVFLAMRNSVIQGDKVTRSQLNKLKYATLALDVGLSSMSKIVNLDMLGCHVTGDLRRLVIHDQFGEHPSMEIIIRPIHKNDQVKSKPKEEHKHG